MYLVKVLHRGIPHVNKLAKEWECISSGLIDMLPKGVAGFAQLYLRGSKEKNALSPIRSAKMMRPTRIARKTMRMVATAQTKNRPRPLPLLPHVRCFQGVQRGDASTLALTSDVECCDWLVVDISTNGIASSGDRYLTRSKAGSCKKEKPEVQVIGRRQQPQTRRETDNSLTSTQKTSASSSENS